MIVAVDPTDAQNGATEVFPGYHRQGYLSARDGDYHELPLAAIDESRGTTLDLAPGARKVAPIVYRGRPYLFWADYRTRPRQELRNGLPRLSGYRHELTVKFSTLGLDGSWLPAGELALGDGAVIDDPLGPQGVPRFDTLAHDDVVEGYRPRGPGWDDVSVDVDPANGALVQLWTCTGAANQRWTLG